MAKGGGGQMGGSGGPVKRGAWLFIAACIALAVWGGAISDPKAFFETLKSKSGDLKEFITELTTDVQNGGVPDISFGGGSGGEGSGLGSSGASNASLDGLTVTPVQSVAYNRDEWRHWDNIGSSCWNVREEVLLRDAEPNSVTLLDRDKRPTSDKSAACYVAGGTWIDPYTGETFANPADLDIDHVVALGETARSGGQAWSPDKKRAYANDLQDPTHLLAVSASANRSKSDQTPATWKPTNQSYWCEYAVAWTGVKTRWTLTVDPTEKAALQEMFATC